MKQFLVRSLSFLLTVTILVSCGKNRTVTSAERGEFDSYFQKFEAYAKQFGVTSTNASRVVIEFGPLGASEVGSCITGSFRQPKIVINQSRWKGLSDAAREALIFHELGHCALGRDHLNSKMDVPLREGGPKVRVPVSIMNVSNAPESIYRKLKNHYLKELFTGRT